MFQYLYLWQESPIDEMGASQGSPLFWPFMLAGFLIFYFFIIRPQQKEQKQLKEFSDGIKKGSKVVTSGGIHGTITELEDEKASVLIAPKTIIVVQRSYISMEMTKAAYGQKE